MSEEEENKPNIFQRIGRAIRIILLLLSFLIIVLIVLLVTRPAFFWNPVVSFLNAGNQLNKEFNISLEEAKSSIEDQMMTLDREVRITISDEILTVMARDSIRELPMITINTRDSELEILWAIEQTSVNELIGRVVLTEEVIENQTHGSFGGFEVKEMGFGRFNLPEGMQRALLNSVVTVLDFGGNGLKDENLVFKMLGASQNFEIKSLEILEGEIEMVLDINKSFYD